MSNWFVRMLLPKPPRYRIYKLKGKDIPCPWIIEYDGRIMGTLQTHKNAIEIVDVLRNR